MNMKNRLVGNIRSLYFLLTLFLVLFACVSVVIGVADVSVSQVINIIGYKLGFNSLAEGITPGKVTIIWDLRMPRILMALLTGINLAVTGAVYQAVFRNDMADPYMLGVSSGASLGAALGFIIGGFLPLWAFIGAMVANVLVLKLSGTKGGKSTFRLLLAGLAMNYFFSSILSYIRISSNNNQLAVFVWGMGSFGAASYTRVLILLVITIPALILFFVYRKELNMLLLGEEAAKSMGVNVREVRQILLVTSSILIAANVAFTGTIGFVGLIIPHMVRLIFGSNYKKTLPLCAFFGMYFVLFCDDLARGLTSAGEMPIGIITSLFGAPYFMYLIVKERRKENS